MASEGRDPTRVERTELDSGLVLVRQAPPVGAASVAATYVGPAGWAFDPMGRDGLAVATAQLLTSGAGPWDHAELDRVLDRLGATLSRRTHPESVEVTVWGPETVWRQLLRVLSEVVLRPRFAPADLDRVRRQLFEHQLRERTQPDARAERELGRLVFPPGHPYRGTGLGDR